MIVRLFRIIRHHIIASEKPICINKYEDLTVTNTIKQQIDYYTQL